jgi:hypothetical protein
MPVMWRGVGSAIMEAFEASEADMGDEGKVCVGRKIKGQLKYTRCSKSSPSETARRECTRLASLCCFHPSYRFGFSSFVEPQNAQPHTDSGGQRKKLTYPSA